MPAAAAAVDGGDPAVIITESEISSNSATDGGGVALDSRAGVATITNSSISENSASSGGGIYSGGTPIVDSITVINSTISGNTANGTAAGMRIEGDVRLINSTVSGNSADSGGGSSGKSPSWRSRCSTGSARCVS